MDEAGFQELFELLADKKPHIFSIEGLIGCGKSTILDEIQKLDPTHGSFTVVREPVDEWSARLEKFYKNPKAEALSFQMFVVASRLKTLLRAIEKEKRLEHTFILERSIFADRIFAEIAIFDAEDFRSYRIFWQTLMFGWKKYIFPIRSYYVNVDIDVCMKRITQRNRKGEQLIKKDYLRRLHCSHINELTDAEHPYGLCGRIIHAPEERTAADIALQITNLIHVHVVNGKPDFKAEILEPYSAENIACCDVCKNPNDWEIDVE